MGSLKFYLRNLVYLLIFDSWPNTHCTQNAFFYRFVQLHLGLINFIGNSTAGSDNEWRRQLKIDWHKI